MKSTSTRDRPSSGWRLLWPWVLLGFALLIGAWITLLTIVSKHPVEPLPLPHKTKPAASSSAGAAAQDASGERDGRSE